jgi:hypothetical protein
MNEQPSTRTTGADYELRRAVFLTERVAERPAMLSESWVPGELAIVAEAAKQLPTLDRAVLKLMRVLAAGGSFDDLDADEAEALMAAERRGGEAEAAEAAHLAAKHAG